MHQLRGTRQAGATQGATVSTEYVPVRAEVCIEIADGIDPFERVTGPEGDDFRHNLYDLHTREDVVNHWAYNAVANGVHDASYLDGWADYERGLITFYVNHVEADY
jgi:hypothetical protein